MPFKTKRQIQGKRAWEKKLAIKKAKEKMLLLAQPATKDPTLPESATFNLIEPLLEAIGEEPVPVVRTRQPLNQVLLVIEDPKAELPVASADPIPVVRTRQPLNQVLLVIEDPKAELPVASADPIPAVTLFCSLCLRPCTSGQVVEFSAEPSWNCLDVASGQEKLGLILGLQLELEQCAICRACWTMVETLADFREGCLKAAAWRERFSFGLDEESLAVGDGWLLKENVEALERTRKMVQEHVERMEIAEVDARNRQDAGVDQLPKVEPLEIDEQEWTLEKPRSDSPDAVNNQDSDEDPPKNESTSDATEIVEKVDFRAFSCKNCQRTFETQSGMSVHYQFCKKSGRGQKLFTCSVCSINFTERRKLKEHRNLHLGIKPFECRKENCNKRFHTRSKQRYHEHKCNGSDHQDESPGDSPQDDAIIETKREIKIYSCSNCPRKFSSKIGLKLHMEQCKGPKKDHKLYTCTICSMDFCLPRSLEAHMNKHNGIKPYKCNRENCGQHFYGKLNLYNHKQICGKDKPICSLCGVQFSAQRNLILHMHIHAEPTIGCEKCSKKFKSNKALKRHQLVHSDERNHPCSVCGKALKSTDALRVHMRIHTQEKPFSCSVCGQGFAYKCLVKPHMKKCLAGED